MIPVLEVHVRMACLDYSAKTTSDDRHHLSLRRKKKEKEKKNKKKKKSQVTDGNRGTKGESDLSFNPIEDRTRTTIVSFLRYLAIVVDTPTDRVRLSKSNRLYFPLQIERSDETYSLPML